MAADSIFIVFVFLRPDVAVSRMLNEARPVTFSRTAYESTNDCVAPPKHQRAVMFTAMFPVLSNIVRPRNPHELGCYVQGR